MSDRADLDQFMRLVSSRLNGPERERAVDAWHRYKLGRGRQAVSRQAPKKKLWTKGAHVRSLTVRAIDLSKETFTGVYLKGVDLRGVSFEGCTFLRGDGSATAALTSFQDCNLQNASLQGADLQGMRLMNADLRSASLAGADLRGADLTDANLRNADLSGAQLQGANLSLSNLVGANLQGAALTGARVYGVAAWDVRLSDDEALTRDLIVTPAGEPEVTTDNLEVAQFLYLLLKNEKIRRVLDTVCKRGVLILGRFTPERKQVLDGLRAALRDHRYVPMIFDFTPSAERDLTETVRILAGMSLFVIADITNPKSSPLELQATVPELMVPFVPIIQKGEQPFAMFQDLARKHTWVLERLEYTDTRELLLALKAGIIDRALKKRSELQALRAKELPALSAADFTAPA